MQKEDVEGSGVQTTELGCSHLGSRDNLFCLGDFSLSVAKALEFNHPGFLGGL